MVDQAAILLLVDDISVLSALRFSLSVEGFAIADGAAEGGDPSMIIALVIDERYGGDGLAALDVLRSQGCRAPAMILATNPTARFRTSIAAANAKLIEKPLLGNELSGAIRAVFEMQKAA
jgi:hypothetical protein